MSGKFNIPTLATQKSIFIGGNIGGKLKYMYLESIKVFL